MRKKSTAVLGAVIQAAREASWHGEDADRPSTIPFYKEARESLDAVWHATALLAENE